METSAWILVFILSFTLLLFLILAIVLTIKMISIANEVKKIVLTSQQIATKADNIVDNVKDMTSVGGLVKTLVNSYNKHKPNKK